jgi:hypothetical protein
MFYMLNNAQNRFNKACKDINNINIPELEQIGESVHTFTKDILEQLKKFEEIEREIKAKSLLKKSKSKPLHPQTAKSSNGFEAPGNYIEIIADKCYHLFHLNYDDYLEEYVDENIYTLIKNINTKNLDILSEVKKVRQDFDDNFKFSEYMPKMMKKFVKFVIDLPSEFIFLRPWYEEECYFTDAPPVFLLKKLQRLVNKIHKEIQAVRYNQSLFFDNNISDKIFHTTLTFDSPIGNSRYDKPVANQDDERRCLPRRSNESDCHCEERSDAAIYMIINEHRELLDKIKNVKDEQFRIDKVLENLEVKQDKILEAKENFDELRCLPLSGDKHKDKPRCGDKHSCLSRRSNERNLELDLGSHELLTHEKCRMAPDNTLSHELLTHKRSRMAKRPFL